MNMKRAIFVFLFTGLFFPSCDNTKPYSQYHRFKNSSWHRFSPIFFDFPVKKNDAGYDIIFVIRHTNHFSEKSLYINFVMTTPSGEERIKDYNLFLKNRDGKFKGKEKDGLYQLDIPLRKGIKFHESGICKVEIENLMTKLNTPGLVEIGLVVERSKGK